MIEKIRIRYNLTEIQASIMQKLVLANGKVIPAWELYHKETVAKVYMVKLRKIFGYDNILNLHGRGFYITEQLSKEILSL